MSAGSAENARSQYLLDGRRVTIKDLVEAGLIAPGSDLVFTRKRVGVVHRAIVTESGRLTLEDGQEYVAPSRAAMVAARMRAVDGWDAWVVASTGKPLDALRQELLDQVVTNATATSDSDHEDHVLTQRVHERLREARRRAESKDPEEMSVRDLLGVWGAKGRGDQITRIEADLANHGLITVPSFRKVTLDATIKLVTAADAPEAARATSVGEETPEVADVVMGMAVGNLGSAEAGVESVKPEATFNEAITKMLLNDYSQLAVLTGPRNIVGAVTWKSIAGAWHVSPQAKLSDAIVDAHVVSYDKELIDILPHLEQEGFFFVKNAQKLISGIVTAADVAKVYRDLASPFFLIGELDRTLRRLIARSFELDVVVAICDPEKRRLSSFNDMSMGDYQRVLERQESWDKLGWPLDRVSFIKRLDDIRKIRNDVMHFNPDPPPPESVSQLRNIIRTLRGYSERSK